MGMVQDKDARGGGEKGGASPLQGLGAVFAGMAANLSPGGLDVALVFVRQHHGGIFLGLCWDQKWAFVEGADFYAPGARGTPVRAVLVGGRGARS